MTELTVVNKPKLSTEAKKFFTDRVNWETSERLSLYRRATGLKWFAIAGWVVASIAIAAVLPLTVMHEFVPIMVIVDKLSGDYEVRHGKQKINTEDKRNDNRMVADIARHVRARVAFTRGEAEQNYRIVFNQIPEEDQGAWRKEYVTSDKAYLKTLTVKDQIKVVSPSVQWLPTHDSLPNHRTAQFRFEKEKRLGGRPPTRQSYIATLTFTYDPKRIPSDIDDLATNPFGFVVVNYNLDPAGPERPIKEEGATQ